MLEPKISLGRIPLIAISSFVILLAICMQIYPGGTEVDPSTVGYTFDQNYISDLGRTVSPSGDNNTVSFSIFLLAFAILTIAFFNYFHGIFQFYRTKYGVEGSVFKLGTFFGMSCCICFLGVALTPANLNMKDHIMFAEWIFRFLFGSNLLYAIAFWQKKHDLLLMSVAHIFMSIGTGIYILLSDLKFNTVFFEDVHTAEVVSQKLIVGFLIVGVFLIGYSNKKNLKNV